MSHQSVSPHHSRQGPGLLTTVTFLSPHHCHTRTPAPTSYPCSSATPRPYSMPSSPPKPLLLCATRPCSVPRHLLLQHRAPAVCGQLGLPLLHCPRPSGSPLQPTSSNPTIRVSSCRCFKDALSA
jgi:hypothetical protein